MWERVKETGDKKRQGMCVVCSKLLMQWDAVYVAYTVEINHILRVHIRLCSLSKIDTEMQLLLPYTVIYFLKSQ